MERAARTLKNTKYSKTILSDEDHARAIWPSAVGKAISDHTSRIRIVRGTLIAEVEDAVWQRQLYPLTSQILRRVQKIMGTTITDVEFRVGIPRREPQRSPTRDGTLWSSESQPTAPPSADEAEQIQDPVLKKVYRLSRKKATA